jgi:hypothetical protein
MSLFVRCTNEQEAAEEVKYYYKHKVLKDKMIGSLDGDTWWLFAYTDGTSDDVSFGAYTYFNLGDTITYRSKYQDFMISYIYIDTDE